MNKKIVATAGIFGLLAIILGAFGAHALKKIMPLEELATFETGVKYQMYHAFFLLFIGISNFLSEKLKVSIFYLTVFGVLFFSGSIYLLSTNRLTSFDFKTIGFITPIGGLLLILAWGLMIMGVVNQKSTSK